MTAVRVYSEAHELQPNKARPSTRRDSEEELIIVVKEKYICFKNLEVFPSKHI